MTIIKSLLFLSSLLLIALSQPEIPTLFSITQGYNHYFPIEKYFHNYQNITISDFTSYENSKNYRICFVGQEHKPYLRPLSKSPILQYTIKGTQLPYNLDDLLKMDKILDTFFAHSHQTLYVISTKQVKIIEIMDDQIKSITNTTLNTSISQAEFIQADSNLLLLTDSKIFSLSHGQNGIQLLEINSLQDEDQIYRNVFMNLDNVVYVTDDSINLVPNNEPNNQLTQPQSIKKSFTQFEYDIENAFFFAAQQPDQNILLVFDQEHTFVTFKIDLMSNQSLGYEIFYRLVQGNKCTKGHRWGSYLFLECRNHIIYLESEGIMKCSDQKGEKMSECLSKVKVSHVNIGFHIRAIQFTTYDDVDFFIITGADKYEIRYLSILSEDPPTNQQNQQKNTTKILGVPPLSTFYPNTNIQKVYLINMNTSLLLSKNTMLMVSQVPQKRELFCKTVDENSQQLLDQPPGNYNATLTVEGFCLDIINQQSLVEIVNQNICRLTVRLILKVDALVQSYQFVWYILLAGIVGILVGLVIFCVIKKRSLDHQYQAFKDQKQNGVQVLQQTMVTQANQQETLSES